METDSAELLERHRKGDPDASGLLFARYVERLTELARWRISPKLRRRIEPEDAVHSAYRSFFVRAGRGDFKLEHAGDLWKLLVSMTLHKLHRQIARHRAAKRGVDREVSLSDRIVIRADGPSPLEALAAVDELESFMASLAPNARTVLRMRLQDRTWQEIAAETGRAVRTIRREIESIREMWRARTPIEITFAEHDFQPVSIRTREPAEFLDYRDFVLNELIDSGGSGKVYRASCKNGDRDVAVKMLRKPRWRSPEAIGRFLREAAIVSSLSHPGIVRTLGVGRTPGGGIFIVMDLIDGSSLTDILNAGPPNPIQAVEWIANAADAVAYAHSRGVIHCDLTPGNLLLANDGRILVGDFGLATNGDHLGWAGTPGFMAPEQLDPAFGTVTNATDVFALGAVLLRCLTGDVAFEGKRILDAISKAVRDWAKMAERPEVPSGLRSVLESCLAIDPRERTQTAEELAAALRSFSQDRRNAPVPPSTRD